MPEWQLTSISIKHIESICFFAKMAQSKGRKSGANRFELAFSSSVFWAFSRNGGQKLQEWIRRHLIRSIWSGYVVKIICCSQRIFYAATSIADHDASCAVRGLFSIYDVRVAVIRDICYCFAVGLILRATISDSSIKLFLHYYTLRNYQEQPKYLSNLANISVDHASARNKIT